MTSFYQDFDRVENGALAEKFLATFWQPVFPAAAPSCERYFKLLDLGADALVLSTEQDLLRAGGAAISRVF
jgi:hypothetical protein